MKILAIDADSRACGWAVVSDALGHERFLDSGTIRAQTKLKWFSRIGMMSDLLLSNMQIIGAVDAVIVEIPGNVPNRKTNVPALQVQSMAIGAAIATAASVVDWKNVHTVKASTWTGGKSKEFRARVHQSETGYEGGAGLHGVDARMLGDWWIQRAITDRKVSDGR